MKVKGPIQVVYKTYVFQVSDLDIAPADYSVGITGDTLEDFAIDWVKHKSGGRRFSKKTKQVFDEWAYNDGIEVVEKAIFDALYKLEEEGYKEAYKRAKKRGYKGSYKEWASEYT